MPDTIGTAYVQIEPSFDGVVSKIDKEMGGAGESGGNSFASGFGKVVGTAGKVVAGAVAAGTAAVSGFAKASVEAGMSFDSSMSQVAATMGTTVDEIGELREFAQEMGSTTAFSASQAADALNYMALAGYDAEKSMAMLPNVLNLAAAGGMELATASDMVTDASSALGLAMDETTDLVDQMAAASSKSNTSVAQLGEAILTVGGTAKGLAGGTVELSTALGLLADNGVKGAEGGTALRNIILSLSAPTDKAAAQLKELGINAFDAEGNMRPLKDVMGDFNSALGSLTEQEKTQALNNIFNKVDLKSVNALLATSTDRWNELSMAIFTSTNLASGVTEEGIKRLRDSFSRLYEEAGGDIDAFKSKAQELIDNEFDINDESAAAAMDAFIKSMQEGKTSADELYTALANSGGAASAMAETQLDNLAGDITLFKSALEGAQIAISDSVSPALREFVQFGADGLSQLTQAFNEEGLSGALEQLGTLLSDAIAMIAEKAPEMVDAGLGLLQALGEGLIENLDTITQSAIEIVMSLAQKLLAPESIQALVEAAVNLIVQLALGLAQALPELIPMAVEAIMTIVTTLLDNIDLLIDAAIELIMGLTEGLINAIPILIEKAPEIIYKLTVALIKNAPKIVMAGVELIMSLINGIVKSFGSIIKTGQDIVTKIKEGFWQKIQDAANWGKDLMKNFIDGILSKWNDLKKSCSDIAGSIKDFIGFSEPDKGPLSDFHTYAPDMMELFATGITDNIGLVTDAMNSVALGVMTPGVDFNTLQTVSGSVDVNSGSDGVIGKIESLLAEYLPNINNNNIYLDTGALVGATAGAYNVALGQIATRGSKR